MQWVYRVNGICGAIFIYGFLGVCSSSITTSLWRCWPCLQSIAMCCVWYIFNVYWGCNRWLYGGSVLYHQSCYSGVCCDWQPLVFSQHGWVEDFSIGIVLDALHAVLSMCLLYIRWHVHTPQCFEHIQCSVINLKTESSVIFRRIRISECASRFDLVQMCILCGNSLWCFDCVYVALIACICYNLLWAVCLGLGMQEVYNYVECRWMMSLGVESYIWKKKY